MDYITTIDYIITMEFIITIDNIITMEYIITMDYIITINYTIAEKNNAISSYLQQQLHDSSLKTHWHFNPYLMSQLMHKST